MNEFIWRPKKSTNEPYEKSRMEDKLIYTEKKEQQQQLGQQQQVGQQQQLGQQQQQVGQQQQQVGQQQQQVGQQQQQVGQQQQQVGQQQKIQEKQKKEIVDPNTFYDNNGVFRMSSSKREEVNLKMHEREPMSQRNQNPYLVQNNYLEDLETQQSFLIPKNSNFNEKKNV
jgi:hypothetical protein